MLQKRELRLGEFIRQKRCSKNMTLSRAAYGVMSTSMLSKYEYGLSDISVTSFICLLDNMDLTLEDVRQWLFENNISVKSEVCKRIESAIQEHDMVYLDKICRSKDGDLFLVSSLAKCNILGKTQDSKSLKALVDYILDVEEWGLYELWIFLIIMPNLSVELLSFLLPEALERSHNLYGGYIFPKLRVKIIVEAIIYYIKNNMLKKAQYFLLELKSILMNYEENLEYRIILMFFEGIISAKKGFDSGREKAKKSIEILLELNASKIANRYNHILNEL